MRLTMLGTGNALVKKIYNTCFVLDAGDDRLLVDTGGGNGILTQLDRAGIPFESIHHLFITHAHTDHLLGAIWVLRLFAQWHRTGKTTGLLHIYSHEKVILLLHTFCNEMIAKKVLKEMEECVVFHTLSDREKFHVGNIEMQAFDIFSEKEIQYGFTALLPSRQRLVCLGDEPYNEKNKDLVEEADWLLCEAFCKYADRDIFHPYEKNHSTAKDAAILAQNLGIKNLVLYHTEESTLATRKEDYTAEARQFFNGRIEVPEDLEVIQS